MTFQPRKSSNGNATNANWLRNISDSRLIGDINLLGTHDSAAINPTEPTDYARHFTSIQEQLLSGVRFFDIRLKVTKKGNEYTFITCHGSIGNAIDINKFEPFDDVLTAFANFLKTYPTEFIIMSLKIDAWDIDTKNKKDDAFYALINLLKDNKMENKVMGFEKNIALSDARNKILVFNRLETSKNNGILGKPFKWESNTSGEFISKSPNDEIYVQDQYKGHPSSSGEVSKFNVVKKAFDVKRDGNIVLNYASACTTLGGVMYIANYVIDYIGAQYPMTGEGMLKLGWTLFDYETMTYTTDTYGVLSALDVIIDSNYSQLDTEHRKYTKHFSIQKIELKSGATLMPDQDARSGEDVGVASIFSDDKSIYVTATYDNTNEDTGAMRFDIKANKAILVDPTLCTQITSGSTFELKDDTTLYIANPNGATGSFTVVLQHSST